MEQTKFRGTGVAIVTPFRSDGTVDFMSLKKLVEHLISNGVNYLVVLGTTGESVTLSKDEKEAVVGYVKEVNNGRVPVVVGIGGNNTTEICAKIQETDFTGIDAVLSVAPYYNKPNQRGIFQHYKQIANVCPVPIILYNVPGRTGSNIAPETAIALAKEFKNIIAIKEASGNFDNATKLLRDRPNGFLVISGDDPLVLPQIALGMDGVISVAANALPKEFTTLVNAALEGNVQKAREIQYKLHDFINALFEDGSPAGIKASLSILGIVENNLRLPLVPVTQPHFEKLQKMLK